MLVTEIVVHNDMLFRGRSTASVREPLVIKSVTPPVVAGLWLVGKASDKLSNIAAPRSTTRLVVWRGFL